MKLHAAIVLVVTLTSLLDVCGAYSARGKSFLATPSRVGYGYKGALCYIEIDHRKKL